MAGFGKLTLTEKGKEALLNAHAGKALKFTKIAMGSGSTSESYENLTDLVDKRAIVDISNGTMDVTNGSYTVEAYFSNSDILEGFEWTEIGLFYEGSDGNDVLYAAANAGGKGDYIPATTDSRYAKYLRITTAVGNASDISINDTVGEYTNTITFADHVADRTHQHSNSFITHDGTGEKFRIGMDDKGEYIELFTDNASEKTYLAHKDDLTPEKIGLGEVPNVSTNNQTPTFEQASSLENIASGDKLNVIMGKIMKAIATLISHIGNKDNPHNVKPSQIGAAESGHTHATLHGITTAGSGSAYTAVVDGISELKTGESFIMIPHVASSTESPSLNVNGLGAKTIRRPVSGNSASTTPGDTASWLAANRPIRVTYNGTYWVTDMTKPNAPDIYGVVSVAHGGTGASTVDAARTALGAVHMEAKTVTLTVAGWSSNKQTVSVSGVTTDNTVIPSPDPASRTAYNEANVYCSAQGNGTLTFTCEGTPSTALTVNVVILT